jgi:hypothetical protein
VLLLIAKVRKRLSLRKQEAQKFDVKRFILKNLSQLEVKTLSDRFAALRNLNDSGDMNRALENIKGNIKISA